MMVKVYKIDVTDSEQLFRLIQSIPSSKAEPFKFFMHCSMMGKRGYFIA
ncbi:MAG: hypothetical protein H7X84_02000 [Verrucomicrobia bacterium]|nr:hypothetical protein [Prolixibacteraceae bacterium]